MKQYPKSNLHTHTSFCDGADTPREIVLSAIDMGMEAIGFSGHSHTAFDTSFAMSREGEALYREEILGLQKEFAGRIRILLGIEQDLYSDPCGADYAFSIGSVHYVMSRGEYLSVDESAEHFAKIVKEHFGGDPYRFVAAYYENVASLAEISPTIIGHFDLVAKFNEGNRFFDESDPRYLRPALDALDVLLSRDVIFEINTGAIARGYRRMAYPSSMLLRRIAQRRGSVTFSSDAHKKEQLLFGFEDAIRFARAAGLGSILLYTRDGFCEYPL